MGLAVAQHSAPGRRQVRQRQCIGRSAGAYQKYRYVTFEHLREPALDPSGQGVVAIRNRESGVGANQSVQNGGRHSGRVVAGEFHVCTFLVASIRSEPRPATHSPTWLSSAPLFAPTKQSKASSEISASIHARRGGFFPFPRLRGR